MSGIRFLYITWQGEVYPIPTPKGLLYKAVPELANEPVLVVDLFYETKNRRPWRLIHVGFDRIQLDEHGQYSLTVEERHNNLHNFFHFGFTTAKELSQGDEPLAIPKAPDIPTTKEKEVLVSFIMRKYPVLWGNSPEAVEDSIESRLNKHSELVNMVKEASLNRRKQKRATDKQE